VPDAETDYLWNMRAKNFLGKIHSSPTEVSMGTTGTLTKVEVKEDGYFISIGSTCCFLEKKWMTVEPKVGDTLTLHTKNLSTVRGAALNGVQIYYKSDAQLEQEYKYFCDKLKDARLKAFEENKGKMDADYEALPRFFKQRIDRFRANNPDFRVEYEPYEMFCCKEAVKIANAFSMGEDVESFKKLPYEEQKEVVPTLDDGHSGNTFGCACSLARAYLDAPDLVPQMHGALAPLVGGEEYGDAPKS